MTHYYVPSATITKTEVDGILRNNAFRCYYRMGSQNENLVYEGCLNNLHLILHDAKTTVRVVGSRCKDFVRGFRTVVMTAPCFPATFIIRVKE